MRLNVLLTGSVYRLFTLITLISLCTVQWGWGQVFYPMSSGDYSQDFADIANWTNNYASGDGSENWRVANSVSPSSIVNNATVFVSGTSGGIQKGTQTIVFLATGTNSGATDLLLNFSGREAGNLSFDYAKVVNSANASPRSSDLKIQYSLDNGATFFDLTGYIIPRIFNDETPESGDLDIPLLSLIDNQSQVVIRFFFWNNGQTGGSGNRPKWSVDNIIVTSTESSSPSLSANPANLDNFEYLVGAGPSVSQSLVITGSDLDETNVDLSAPTGYELAKNSTGPYEDIIVYESYDGTEETVYVRLKEGMAVGAYNGNIVVSGGGASDLIILLEGEVFPLPPSLEEFDLPYIESFTNFLSATTLPNGWEFDDDYTYGGNFGAGTAGGTRGNGAAGFQLTGSSPNNAMTLSLTLINNTGTTIENLQIEYLGRVARTDQTGLPKWVVSLNGIEIEELEYSTATGVDEEMSAIVTELNFLDGEFFTIEWFTTSTGTTGTRRQIGVSDVSIVALSALPVDLLTFTATPQRQQQVVLDWTFDNARGFEKFVVEHTTALDRNWTELGEVHYTESISRSKQATYTHLRVPAGINYYRLRMVDADGSDRLSRIQSARVQGANIRPVNNPMGERLLLTASEEFEGGTATLNDLYGRILLHRDLPALETQFELPTASLVPGM